MNEILAAIDNLKIHIASGIKPKFLKSSKNYLVIPLKAAFNGFSVKGFTRGSGVIAPCFKQGDPMDYGPYRGIQITLVPMLDKLFSLNLDKRLTDWAEKNIIRAAC
jgi:hypothetical protein